MPADRAVTEQGQASLDGTYHATASDEVQKCFIHRLPFELLGQILQSHLAQDGSRLSVPYLQELASVCRAWRQAILGTPALWTSIHAQLSPTHLEWCIVRSRALPLSIESRGRRRFQGDNFWMDTVMTQSHRWEEVNVSVAEKGVEYASKLVAALGSPTPMLRKLTMKNDQPGAPVNLHDEGPPLVYLSLIGCTLHWELRRICGGELTFLSLDHLDDSRFLSPNQLLSLVSASPTLTTLILRWICYSTQPGPLHYPNRGRSLEFPCLRTLAIEYLGPMHTQHLINHLTSPLPLCRALRLFIEARHFDLSSSWSLGQVRMIVQPEDWLDIQIYDTFIVIAKEPDLRLHLGARGQDNMDALIQQAATLVRLVMSTDNLHLGFWCSTDPLSALLLRLFDSARRITVGNRNRSPFLKYLVHREGDEIYPFPNLRRLNLTGLEESRDAVESLLRARWIKVGVDDGSGVLIRNEGIMEVVFGEETELWGNKGVTDVTFE